MNLTEVIKGFITDNEWDDEVDINEETGESQLSTSIGIINQSFQLYVEGDEKGGKLSLYLYAPFHVIEGKFVDACMLFNYLNDIYSYSGRIGVSENGVIRYKEIINIEDIELVPDLIHNMFASSIRMFENHNEAIASVALTKKTYEAVREDYAKKDEAREGKKAAFESDSEESPATE